MIEGRRLAEVEAAQRSWERNLPPAAGQRTTLSGIPIKPLYGPADLGEWDYLGKVGFPGEYPFVRGRTPLSRGQNAWIVGEYAGFDDAKSTNEYIKYLAQEGLVEGLYVALDLPTQIGYDSDDPRALGEVGRVGVAIDSFQDFEALFEGIPLDRVIPGSPVTHIAAWWLAMLLALLEKQGMKPQALRAVTSNGCLMDYYARGTGIFPPTWGLKLSNDVTEYCVRNGLVGVESQTVAGYNPAEAGLTGCQEVAVMLAEAEAYIEDLLRRGLSIDAIAPHFVAFAALGEELFEEVAKLRALRRMWARMMRDRFGAREKASQALNLRAMTAGSNLTSQQPLNNIVRVTVEALAGVLGGVQRLECSAYDEALAIPTREAARVAMRTQQILALETGVANTLDPLAGSYYVEWLTDEVERRAQQFLDAIGKVGGLVTAIESGFMAEETTRSAYERLKQLETGQRTKVGVNCLRVEETAPLPIRASDPLAEERQVEKVQRLRRERDNGEVERSLARLREAATAGVNMVPPMVEAVKSYATIGEIFGALRTIWGEWKPL